MENDVNVKVKIHFINNYKQTYFKTKNTSENIEIVDNRIQFLKLGLVKLLKSREVEGCIMNAAVRRNPETWVVGGFQ